MLSSCHCLWRQFSYTKGRISMVYGHFPLLSFVQTNYQEHFTNMLGKQGQNKHLKKIKKIKKTIFYWLTVSHLFHISHRSLLSGASLLEKINIRLAWRRQQNISATARLIPVCCAAELSGAVMMHQGTVFTGRQPGWAECHQINAASPLKKKKSKQS